MIFKTDIKGFDGLTMPIVVCDADGIVIYKNDAAVKQIRLPKRRTDIHIHLSPSDCELLDGISKFSDPLLLRVFTGDRDASAFVALHEWEGSPATLWIFLSYMQSNASGTVVTSFEKNLSSYAKDVCEIVKYVDINSRLTDAGGESIACNKIRKRLERLVSNVLRDRESVYVCALSQSVSALFERATDVFRSLGYDVIVNISPEVTKNHNRINYRDMLLFYVHIVTLSCEMTRNKRVCINIFENKYGETVVSITFSVIYPPFRAVEETDMRKLAELIEGHDVDLVLIKSLIDICGYSLKYTVNDETNDNINFRFVIPYMSDGKISNIGGSDRSEKNIEPDTLTFITDLLVFSGFASTIDQTSY